MDENRAFRDVVENAIGGGWGKELEFEDSLRVAVIRGTDLHAVRFGETSGVPIRFESESKANRRILQDGDIVLEISGGSRASDQPTGRTLLITDHILNSLPAPAIPASFCRRIRLDKTKVIPRYAFYALQDMYNSRRVLRYEHHSTGISNFQFEYFLDNEFVYLPDLDEQQRIAHVLGTLDDKIELNRKMNETLEEIARTLFTSWFVNFDPVRAKAAGEQPFGMDEATAALFPDSFVDSELGPIPSGWEVARLGEIASLAIGGDWGDDQEAAGLVECYCLRGVDLEHLRTMGDAPKAPKRWLKESSLRKRTMSENDVLIGGSGAGPTGRPLWVSSMMMSLFDAPVSYSNFCKRLTCQTPQVAAYVDRILHEMRMSGEIWQFVSGTSVPNLNASGLLATKWIMVPPGALLEKFHSILVPIQQKLFASESRTLAEIRDTLLPKLLSGDLRVPEAEQIAEEVGL